METIKMLELKMQTCIRELDGLTDVAERKAKVEEIKGLGQTLKELQLAATDDEDKFRNFGLKAEQAENEQKNKKIDHGIAIAGLGLSAAALVTTFIFDGTGKIITSTLGRNILNGFIPKKR